MARVSVVYDKDIKEQVFMVRGDERYTHSTKTVIELRSVVEEHFYGYVQEIFVNVFRDVGTGSLVIYDNDTVIKVVHNWSSIDTGRVIELPQLTYEGEHNIKVRYTGNNQCSPSMSNLIHIDSQVNPNKQSISLKLEYTKPTENEITSTVYFEGHPEISEGKQVKIYCNDVLKDTVTINSSPRHASTTFSVEDGLYKVKAVFEGTTFLRATNTTRTVHVGYSFLLLSAPRSLISQEPVTFSGKVTSYQGTTGVASKNVRVKTHSPSNTIATGTTNSNGIVELTGTVPLNCGDGTIDFIDMDTNKVIGSAVLPWANVTSFDITSSTPRLYKNEECILTADINQSVKNIPITFEQLDSEEQVIKSVTSVTDSNGKATTVIKGTGKGQQSWRATVGSTSKLKEFKDYYQYWSPDEERDVTDYILTGSGVLLKLESLYRVRVSDGNMTFFEINVPQGAYELEFKSPRQIGVGKHFGILHNDTVYAIDPMKGLRVERDSNDKITVRTATGKLISTFNRYTGNIKFGMYKSFEFRALTIIDKE